MLGQVLAGIQEQLAEGSDPLAAARRAIVLDPANAQRHVDLARQLASAGNLPDAEAALREAIRLQPGTYTLYIMLAENLVRQGRRADALVSAQLAYDVAPDSAHAVGYLGHAYQFNNELDRSISLYEKAVSLAPNNGHLRKELAYVMGRRAHLETTP
jgi:tetratricopeptide (TPR) repeat protein